MFEKKILFIIISVFLLFSLIFVYGIIKKSKIAMVLTVFFLIVCISIVSFFKITEKYKHKNLRVLLKDVIEKFNKYKINYWVDYGTLLGLVRENDIIKHDSDIDICLHPNNTNLADKLAKICDELGADHTLTYEPRDRLFRIFQTNIRNPIKHTYFQIYSDLYMTKMENDYYVDCSGKLHKSLLGKTKKIEWEGLDVTVPEKIHETLVWRYGENYMTPIRNKPNERYKNILLEEGYKII